MSVKRIIILLVGMLIPCSDVASGFILMPGQDGQDGTNKLYIPSAYIDTTGYFEGTLFYSLEINGISQDLRYHVRREQVRIEIDDPHLGGTTTILAAPGEEKMVILIHELQSYTDLVLEDITGRADYLIEQVNKLKPTGNKKETAGITTHEYQLRTENGEMLRLWAPGHSRRYGTFQFPGFIDRILSEMLRSALPADLFPFTLNYQGKRSTVNITLIRIQEEKLDMDLFSVPANYRKLLVTIPGY